MSIPASESALKDYLLAHDDRYRDLVNEHRRYEARLSELASLPHPSEEELLEETLLKKKKLFLKDQMEIIASKYKASLLGQ
jgi:uncharacterized protein YdcH (DUF465 family)